MTIEVPSARLRVKLRLGLRISPAVKVTLFQASAENNEPTIAPPATMSAASNPTPPTVFDTSAKRGVSFMPLHKSDVLPDQAVGLKTIMRPTTMSSIRASVLATVKVFWTILPS